MVPVSQTEKRAALSQILASRTLSRCRQLQTLLHYIAEAEISGRGAELTEYKVAVEALNRKRLTNPSGHGAPSVMH